MVKEKSSPIQLPDIGAEDVKEIVLYNDDFNTFDFVIETLIEVCEHSVEQAETCTWIVHYKGKCAVKSGFINDLQPIYQELTNRTLTAKIE
ncbi:MAG: ATP-dependent Clp protease adaptor ClpS [Bacteroidetes bacterium]|nr:ATP-dependent Clp protease adaptor ClpS [Bacteroidales bacterium]MBU1010197.1 ATP-dependent Clp protease adaptor ClpS [Bacteroidota bacterium]